MAQTSTHASAAQRFQGPWMKSEVLGALPQLQRDYQRETDPEREAMVQHLQKPEHQRRQESVLHEAQRRANAPHLSYVQNRSERGEQDRGDQGSGEQSDGRGSAMVGKDKPELTLRPPDYIARPPDQSTFTSAWLTEQRDAAFAAAKDHQAQTNRAPEQSQNHQPYNSEPQR